MNTAWTPSAPDYLQYHAYVRAAAPALLSSGQVLSFRQAYEQLRGLVLALRDEAPALPGPVVFSQADPCRHFLLSLALDALGIATLATSNGTQIGTRWPQVSDAWWQAAVGRPLEETHERLRASTPLDDRMFAVVAGTAERRWVTRGIQARRVDFQVHHSQLGSPSVLHLWGQPPREPAMRRAIAGLRVGAAVVWRGEGAPVSVLRTLPAPTHVWVDADDPAAVAGLSAWAAGSQHDRAALPVDVEGSSFSSVRAALSALAPVGRLNGTVSTEACGPIADHLNPQGVAVLLPGVRVTLSQPWAAVPARGDGVGDVVVHGPMVAAGEDAASDALGLAAGFEGRLLGPRYLQLQG